MYIMTGMAYSGAFAICLDPPLNGTTKTDAVRHRRVGPVTDSHAEVYGVPCHQVSTVCGPTVPVTPPPPAPPQPRTRWSPQESG